MFSSGTPRSGTRNNRISQGQRRGARQVIFFGFALSQGLFDELLASDIGMPVQTQRFGWAVIEALQRAGVEVSVVSAAPALDYPKNSRIYFGKARFQAQGVEGIAIPFVNVIGVKHASRYLSSLVLGHRAATRQKPSAVIVHGVHSPFIWSALRVGRRFGIPVIVIMTDAPSLRTEHDSKLSWRMKSADRRLILSGLRRVDGVITLTSALAEDFAPGRPSLLMEGIARPLPLLEEVQAVQCSTGTDRYVMYAGGLREEYGVRELVRSVAMSTGDWKLRVYGRGPLQPEIEAVAAASDRVEFGGLADTREVARGYAQADLLINPRSVHADFARYSFPSKILEYMASGRPVLTTELPEIPADYAPHLNFAGEDAASLARAIDSMMQQSRTALDEAGTTVKQFIIETRGPEAQGVRMREFLDELIDGMASSCGVPR